MKNDKPHSKKIRQFLEKGGYDIIEAQDPPGWVNPKTEKVWYGLYTSLKEKTGIKSPLTFMKIQRLCPTRADAERHLGIKPQIVYDYTNRVWIKKEGFELLKEAYYRLEEAKRILKRAQEYAQRYIYFDVARAQQVKAFTGKEIRLDDYIRDQLELSERRQSELEGLLNDLDRELHKVWLDLHTTINIYAGKKEGS